MVECMGLKVGLRWLLARPVPWLREVCNKLLLIKPLRIGGARAKLSGYSHFGSGVRFRCECFAPADGRAVSSLRGRLKGDKLLLRYTCCFSENFNCRSLQMLCCQVAFSVTG